MPDLSPAEVLRAAAARLRELAGALPFAATLKPAVGAYLAAMRPDVARAFAGLLEDAAGQYDALDECPYPGAAGFVAGDFGGDPDPALVAARAVLAGDQP